ncbi:Fic family protein, partial [bacterium]|nr:Fic family protein [bacterium]
PIAYRNYDVTVAQNQNFKICPARKIEAAMNEFIENYKKLVRKTNNVPKALELAAFVYNELIHIQPYEDGNSRLSMLAMTHVLKLFRTGVNGIPRIYDIRFIRLTKGASKRNDAELVELLKEITLLSINKADLKEMLSYI